MRKLSVKRSRKSNQFRRKSKLRRRRNTRKIYTRKTNIIEGGGGAMSVARKKRWDPNKFFPTKYWEVDRCSGVAFHDGWKSEIYHRLNLFFDRPEKARQDACSHQQPINVENINQENKKKYLRFYSNKLDWLVNQLCIYEGGGCRFVHPPRVDFPDPGMNMFFLWLTNNTADIPNPHFKNKTAPNPDDYDEETGASDEETRRLLSVCDV